MANTGTDYEPPPDIDDEDYTWPPRGHVLPATPPRPLPAQVGAEFIRLERRVAFLERIVHKYINQDPAPALSGDASAEQ